MSTTRLNGVFFTLGPGGRSDDPERLRQATERRRTLSASADPLDVAAAALRGLAREATPGPWGVAHRGTHLQVVAAHQLDAGRSVATVYCDLDAAYLSALDPQSVLM